jgi:hypothetical protein
LNILTESLSNKYLGLSAMIGMDKSDCFCHVIDRVFARINGWKEKLLSMGGKEILIKAIAQAIPTYAMSCFDLTKTLCDEISSMICRY